MTKQGGAGSVRAMDNNAQPTAKQNAIEALRSAESVVITTAKNPTRDQIAAAIGLHLLLVKLDKVAEVVVRHELPKELSFLPRDFINSEIQGQRDFIIQLDQSRTEADRLKYLTEDGKLKVYITPYNGLYSKDDVSFDYGDYHCDAIVGLGTTSVNGLDSKLSEDPKLTENAQFIFIASEGDGGGPTSWVDQAASSVCEMVMSMSEALGSGMMDREIATALFTGIVDKTEHFTNSATSPKVMTMAAQLLAAGANQAEVVKQLSVPTSPPVAPTPNTPAQETTSQAPAAQAPEPERSPQSPAPAPKPEPEPAPAPQEPKNEFQLRQPHDEPRSSSDPASSSGEVDFHNDQPTPAKPQSVETSSPAQNPTQSPTPQPSADNKSQPSSPAFTGTVGASVSMPQPKATPPPQASAPPQPPAPTPSPQPPTPTPATTPNPPQAPAAPQQPPASSSEDSFAMPRERVVQPPASGPQASSPPPSQGTPPQQSSSGNGNGNMSDVEAARRALEEAHKNQSPPQQPPGPTSS